MRKRYFVLTMMLVSCFLICGTKASAYANFQTFNTGEVLEEVIDICWDSFADEFMSEDGVFTQDDYFIRTCEIDLIYDSGENSIASDSMSIMSENHGIEATAYQFEKKNFYSTSSVYTPGQYYLYLDVIFGDNAMIGTEDKLMITLPAGLTITNTEPRGRWAQPDTKGNWTSVQDFTISAVGTNTNHIVVPLNRLVSPEGSNQLRIVPVEGGSRLLLSLCVTPTFAEVEDNLRIEVDQRITVVWQHTAASSSNAVISPGLEKNDSLWKIILLIIVLILDVVVAVIVYLKLKQRPKEVAKPINQTAELCEGDVEALKEKLPNNLKLNDADMEYLNSIGYFDTKSLKRKDT